MNAGIADIAVNSTPLSSGKLDQFSVFWFSKIRTGEFFFFTTVLTSVVSLVGAGFGRSRR